MPYVLLDEAVEVPCVEILAYVTNLHSLCLGTTRLKTELLM